MKGILITFEGIDGCGKSTQAAMARPQRFDERGETVVHTREPGGTELGRRFAASFCTSRAGNRRGDEKPFYGRRPGRTT